MAVPQAFGPYEVVRSIGQGGMGRVLEVRHPDLPDRRLALKLATTGRVQFHERFLREVELLGRVRHPGVVPVHAAGQSPEGPWLVMDLVEGRSLSELVADGPVPPRRAAELGLRLAEALAAVHAAGVLHRDVKPENVLLRPDGSPVLVDFGIARAADADRLTTTGTLVGSPLTMAPEQLDGTSPERLDARVDVWGLGTILFALLAGELPFDGGGTMGEVIARVISGEPPWPAAPRPLLAIVRRALAKRPADRQPDAATVASELRAYLAGAVEARTPIAIAVAPLALAVVALSVWSWRGAPEQAAPPADPAAPSSADPVPVESRRARPWLSLEPPQHPERPAARWLPDGRRFLTWQPAEPDAVIELCVWQHEPWAEPRLLASHALGPGISALDLAPSGRIVCLERGTGALWVLDTAGDSPPRRLVPSNMRERPISALVVSPDGATVAISHAAGERGRATIVLYRLEEGGARELRAWDFPDPSAFALLFLDGERLLVGGDRRELTGGATIRVLPDNDEGGLLTATHTVTVATAAPDGQVWVGLTGRWIQPLSLPGLQLGRPLEGVATRRGEHDRQGIQIMDSHRGAPGVIRFGDGLGRRMVSLSGSGLESRPPERELRVWERTPAGAWRNTAGIGGWPRGLQSLDVSPDGAWVLVGHGGRIERWAWDAIPAVGPDALELPRWERTVTRLGRE